MWKTGNLLLAESPSVDSKANISGTFVLEEFGLGRKLGESGSPLFDVCFAGESTNRGDADGVRLSFSTSSPVGVLARSRGFG